jgi:hypothetical protein
MKRLGIDVSQSARMKQALPLDDAVHAH